VGRCLAKNRKERWHSIADVRVELQSIIADPYGLKLRSANSSGERRPLWKRAISIAATAILAGTVGAAAVWTFKPSQTARLVRFSFVLQEGQHFTNRGTPIIAISPDGANIVYVANEQLYLRPIGEMEARPIQGTAKTPYAPFFSRDGSWVGFYSRADRRFEKVSITGGAAVPICDAGNFPWSATWGPNDQIFMAHPTGDIQRVSANGGKFETVVAAKPDELFHAPQVLPGGNALLFTVASTVSRSGDRWENAQIVVQSLKSGERTVLMGGRDARYVPTGHIVYALGSTLFAIRFDVKTLRLVGGPVAILEGVQQSFDRASGAAQFSFSNNGSMVYVPGEQGTDLPQRTLSLADLAGVLRPLTIPPGRYSQPRISPNGQRLVLDLDDGKDRYVAIYDLLGAAPLRRLTFGGHNERPIWSPDGERIVFASDRDGDEGLFWQRADGNGTAERLAKVEPGIVPQPEAWTPDGKTLIFNNRIAGRTGGLATFSPGTDQKPKLLLAVRRTPASRPTVSWLAYFSNDSLNKGNVYVEPFPPSGQSTR
jgi:Tol biopolymer transport system component